MAVFGAVLQDGSVYIVNQADLKGPESIKINYK